MARTLPALPVALRPAAGPDLEAIATLWHRAWLDGHRGHVPDALLPHRELDDFRRRTPERLATTTVATLGPDAAGPAAGAPAAAGADGDPAGTAGSGVVGFVVVRDDEIEQLYVDASARGGGVADALLRHGETVIATRHDRAWLAVVAGNARARRFYERNGWSDTGPIDYPARTAAGVTVLVPARRYQKRLTAPVGRHWKEAGAPAGRAPRTAA